MLISRVVVAVVAVLLVPLPAVAGSFHFLVSDGDLSVAFGLTPFTVAAGLRPENANPVPFSFDGAAELVSGPLLDMTVDDGLTSYSYGAGTLTLTLSVDDDHGHQASGHATFATLPFQIVVCEGCDPLFDGSEAEDFTIDLGAGLFDASLAHVLGIRQHAGGGSIDFGLEDIGGDPDSQRRVGFDHRGYAPLAIIVQEVPEPSFLLLLVTAATATFARRGTSRARTSGTR